MRQQATATVELLVEVTLSSAWGPDCTIGQVQSQAQEAALRAVREAIEGRSNLRLKGTSAVTVTVASK